MPPTDTPAPIPAFAPVESPPDDEPESPKESGHDDVDLATGIGAISSVMNDDGEWRTRRR